jgi:hypothetical protein
MTLNEYQEAALRTARENVPSYHDLLHGGMGVATEAGELLDVIKKHHAYGKEIDLVNLREEIGMSCGIWPCFAVLRARHSTRLPTETSTNCGSATLKSSPPSTHSTVIWKLSVVA